MTCGGLTLVLELVPTREVLLTTAVVVFEGKMNLSAAFGSKFGTGFPFRLASDSVDD